MTNYTAKSRTNYFKVKSIEAFKEALEPYDMEIWEEEKNGEPHVAFGGSNGYFDLHNEETDEHFTIVELIQPHLVDGEACILLEVGNEKLRYLVGVALIITPTAQQYLNLQDSAVQLAAALTEKDPTDFHMHY